MINGTEIEYAINIFNTNVWTMLAITVGVIMVASYTMGNALMSYIKRPKIEFEPKIIIQDIKKHDKFDYKEITLLVYLKNTGKLPSFQSRVRMRITDHSGKIDIGEATSRTINDDFPVPCVDVDNISHPIVDLLPTNRFDYHFKIPFVFHFATSKEDVLGDSSMPSSISQFTKPLENMKWSDLFNNQHEFQCKIEITITSQDKLFKTKKFEIKISDQIKTIVDPTKILFVKTK